MINIVKEYIESLCRLMNNYYSPIKKPNDELPVGILFYMDFPYDCRKNNKNKYIVIN